MSRSCNVITHTEHVLGQWPEPDCFQVTLTGSRSIDPKSSQSMNDTAIERSSVTITVLFFARAREITSEKSISIAVPASTTPWNAFTEHILPRYPSLAVLSNHCALALNQEYVTREAPEQVLRDRDELAVIPPISGG